MKPGKLKIIIPLLLLCTILTACGNPEIGDMFTMKRNVLGGMKINSMKNAVDEMEMFEEMGDPAAMEENLNHDEIASISVGEIVRVRDISDKHRMVQVQNINPNRVRVKMWIDREKFKNAVR